MAVAYKMVADGQVPTGTTTLYSPGSGLAAATCRLRLLNTNASSRTVTISLHRNGGTLRTIAVFTLAQNEPLDMDIGELANNDLLRASASAATSVNYTVQAREVAI